MLGKRKVALSLIVALMLIAVLVGAVGCKWKKGDSAKNEYNVTIQNIDPLDSLKKAETKVVDGKINFKINTAVVGFTFKGLYSGDSQYYDADGVTLLQVKQDMILTCKWEPKKYEIQFMNGSVLLEKTTFVYNSTNNVTPEVPADVGYECAGWAAAEDLTKKIIENEKLALEFNCINFPDFDFNNSKAHFYPVIEKKTLSVSFAYGGSDVARIKVKYGDPLPKAPAREYPNKRIVGWTTVEGGNIHFTNVITDNITLYPIFADLRTLTFETRGGEAIAPIRAVDGEKITIPTPTRLYYSFVGWYATSLLNGAMLPPEHVTNGDMTFYAKWDVLTYNLTFNTLSDAPAPNSVKYTFESDTFTLPTLADEAHRKFKGWSVVKNDRANVITVLDPKKNCGFVEIFAVWKGEDINVTMDDNGSISNCIIEYGADFTLQTLTKQDYVFCGWSISGSATALTDKNGKSITPWTGSNKITVCPIWEKLYSLTFDTKGSDVVEGTRLIAGDKVALLTLNPRYKYDTFLGWSYKGVTYKDNFTMLEEDVLLTAEWNTMGFKYIRNGADFWKINEDLNTDNKGQYMLTQDIDLSAYNWEGIGARGNDHKAFAGVIDGDGHKITGFKSDCKMLRNNPSDKNYAYWGLFVKSAGAMYKDFTLENANVNLYQDGDKGTYQYLLGGVTGSAEDTIFMNINVSGSVLAADVKEGGKDWSGTCYTYVGGLAGYAANSQFINCQNSARVASYGGDSNAGGIVGGGEAGLLFKNCKNSGAICARGSWQEGCTAFAGGIMGLYTKRVPGTAFTFENSSSTGALTTFGGLFTEKKSHPILAAPVEDRP